MTTDIQVAARLLKLYAGPTGFDWYAPPPGNHGICWALTISPEEYSYDLRGSASLNDWLRDFTFVQLPFEHPRFGGVYPGFFIGMDDACDSMYEHWDKKTPLSFNGHSLGGGRANIAAAEFLARGVPPSLMRRVTFGCPKTGTQAFADYIGNVAGVSYRNGYGRLHDFVTSVPLTLPGLWYVPDVRRTDVTTTADQGDSSLALHHLPLYAQALTVGQ
jgi:Lipase (class 3)